MVAPVRERGLKKPTVTGEYQLDIVAPVRERGLKCRQPTTTRGELCRSRKGAWIETLAQ